MTANKTSTLSRRQAKTAAAKHATGITSRAFSQMRKQFIVSANDTISNMREFHAFAALGSERLFLSHLTMLDMENHRYQFILEASLPEPWISVYRKERKTYPKDSYFIANTLKDSRTGNTIEDPMTVPELQSRRRTSFVGNVYRGIPHKLEYNRWPWEGVRPVLQNVPISVKRIVHFRPFAANMNYPETLTYLLFGAGREAHMVHYQIKEPDYDHILSLNESPTWLAEDLLEAGIIVDLPDLPRLTNGGIGAGMPCENPFKDGQLYSVRYRGEGVSRNITIGRSFWFCTRIANHPDPCKGCKDPCGSPTPEKYMVAP